MNGYGQTREGLRSFIEGEQSYTLIGIEPVSLPQPAPHTLIGRISRQRVKPCFLFKLEPKVYFVRPMEIDNLAHCLGGVIIKPTLGGVLEKATTTNFGFVLLPPMGKIDMGLLARRLEAVQLSRPVIFQTTIDRFEPESWELPFFSHNEALLQCSSAILDYLEGS